MGPTVLSLFSGYAGLDIGLHAALEGGRTVGYVEREAYPAAVLLARMEEQTLEPAPIWCGDIADLDTAAFADRVDWITGGFPCQPWSTAGKRAGTADERWLWDDIERVIREVRPRWCLLENVPGLVRGGLGPVLGSLSVLGFDAEWGRFSAEGVGASHRRERVFILARRRDTVVDAGGELADTNSQQRGPAQGPADFQNDGRDYVGGRGPQLADAERGRGTQELRSTPSRGSGVDSRSQELADAERSGGEPKPGRETGRPRHAEGGATPQHNSDTVADARRELLEGRREAREWSGPGSGREPVVRRLFAPGPADVRGWARIMAVRPDLAPAMPRQGSAAQSAFRERTHGSAILVDGGPVNDGVSGVREGVAAEEVLVRRSGEPFDARPSQVLQSPLHGRWNEEVARRVDAIWALGEGTPAFEECMRALWDIGAAYDPPHRQRLAEQLAREPDNVMSVLSYHAPPPGGRDRAKETPALLSRLRRIVCAEGFKGTDLLTTLWVGYAEAAVRAMTYRQDRLRAIGNGVVPLQAATAIRVLAARAGWKLRTEGGRP